MKTNRIFAANESAEKTRVNVVTAVNKAKVTVNGDTITIHDVVPIVDNIVMNNGLYPADQIQSSYLSINNAPAPAGHPRDEDGNYISAKSGKAISNYWIGAYCANARKKGKRVLVDVVVNSKQAAAMPEGKKFLDRLQDPNNNEPINISTGLFLNRVEGNGESNGKKYNWIANNLEFDHLAILLEEAPAATPQEGVGMWVNSAGEQKEIEVASLNELDAIEDKRSTGLFKWIMRLVGNESELSYQEITEKLQSEVDKIYRTPTVYPWVMQVWDKEVVCSTVNDEFYKQGYSISADGGVTLDGVPVKVQRSVTYSPVPVGNQSQKDSEMKDTIVIALNAAGISTEGKTDAQLLDAYNQLKAAPIQAQLNAVNEKLTAIENAAKAAEEIKVNSLVEKIVAAGSPLPADELKKLSLNSLEKLLPADNKQAAPINLANNQSDSSKNVYQLPE